jgi:type VI secretion system protein ImpH
LIAQLSARPGGFNLFQAISLLERAVPGARALGRGNGAGEAVRLRGLVSLAFQPADVRSVRQEAPGDEDYSRPAYTLTTPVLTLAGTDGPLPLAFTEMLLERQAARDHATSELLDIFNHRFLSFLYRGRKKHAPALAGQTPAASTLASCLDALSNLGLRRGERGPHGAALWLGHAGLLGGGPRSMAGLLALLSDRLGLRMGGAQFVGAWRTVDEGDSLRLSARGTGAQAGLGLAGMLGRRIWDQVAGIRIDVHALAPERVAALLPGGRDYELMAWLVHCHAQQELNVELVLHIASRQPAPLGRAASRLGWTSWLAAASDTVSDTAADASATTRRPAMVRLALRAAGGAPQTS